MAIQIINRFGLLENIKDTHSEEYLEDIANQTTLEDLVETVAMWIHECKGDKYKAAMYILDTLDQEED